MNYEELADWLVERGVSNSRKPDPRLPFGYIIPGDYEMSTAEGLCHDGRTVLEAMDHLLKHGEWDLLITPEVVHIYTSGYQFFTAPKSYQVKIKESNGLAILQAIREATDERQ